MSTKTGKESDDWSYDLIVGIITSPTFRTPIKNFIDENCSSFTEVSENTFEQGGLFKEFVALIENLLNSALRDNGIPDEMFLNASQKGLNDEKYKKYFVQLIEFSNYNYFKKLMTHRNYQILRQAEQALNNKQYQEKKKKHQGKFDEKEIEEAIKLSLKEEEEKRKLRALEDEDLKKAIWLSQKGIKKSKNTTPEEIGDSDSKLTESVRKPKLGSTLPENDEENLVDDIFSSKKNEFIPPKVETKKPNIDLLVDLEETKGMNKINTQVISQNKGFSQQVDSDFLEYNLAKQNSFQNTGNMQQSTYVNKPIQLSGIVSSNMQGTQNINTNYQNSSTMEKGYQIEGQNIGAPPGPEMKNIKVQNEKDQNKFFDMVPENQKKDTSTIKVQLNNPNRGEVVKVMDELDKLFGEEEKEKKEEQKKQQNVKPGQDSFNKQFSQNKGGDANKNNFIAPEQRKQLNQIRQKKLGALYNPITGLPEVKAIQQSREINPSKSSVVQDEDEYLREKFANIEKEKLLELQKFRVQLIQQKKLDREKKEKEAVLTEEDKERMETRKKLIEKLKKNQSIEGNQLGNAFK